MMAGLGLDVGLGGVCGQGLEQCLCRGPGIAQGPSDADAGQIRLCAHVWIELPDVFHPGQCLGMGGLGQYRQTQAPGKGGLCQAGPMQQDRKLGTVQRFAFRQIGQRARGGLEAPEVGGPRPFRTAAGCRAGALGLASGLGSGGLPGVASASVDWSAR